VSDKVPQSYAKALFEVASAEDAVHTVEADLEKVVATIKGHLKLKEVLGDAQFPASAKRDIIRQVFEESLSPLTLGMLTMLVDAGRDGELAAVAAAYADIAEAGTGAVTAKVRTAVPLTDDLRAELLAKLTAMAGKDVALRETVDATLLGGVIVEMGGQVLDGSVRGRLSEMKNQLTAARSAKEGEA